MSIILLLPLSVNNRESMWPVMEAMSQDAIDEMVENIFRNGDLDRDGR